MWSVRPNLAVLAAVAVFLTTPLWAQDRLAPALINANSALAPEQQQQVDGYINNWMGQMANGNDEQVTKAREKLSEPFTLGGTRLFNTAYSTSLTTGLQQGLASDRLIVRLNAMMIAARMVPSDAAALIEKGLEDANPAIRYAAARAANEVASREDRPPAAVQMRMLDGLTKQLNVERVQIVLEQLLLGISSLDIAEASDRLLNGLNQRITLHVKEPNTPLGADREAMARLFRRYVLQTPESDEVVRKLTQVAFRHLDLSTRLLDGGKLSDIGAQDRQAMAMLSDRILRWAAEKRFATGGKLPESAEKALAAGNYKMVRLYIEDWRKLLTTEQIGFIPAQLALPE